MFFIDFIKQAVEYNNFEMYEALYMVFRAIVIYILGMVISRSNKKIMDIHTPFNFTLFVMLGSIYAQSILVKEVFLQVVCAIFALVIFNFFLKKLAFHFQFVESFVKGYRVFLIEKGLFNWDQMNKYGITKRELLNELASQLHTYDLSIVCDAILASDGTINFILKDNSKECNK